MHPREHRLTRRNLMRGALGAGAVVGVAGVTAGCANTTDRDRLGRRRRDGRRAQARRPAADRPGRPAPAAHRQRVTWAITDDNPPIKNGLKPEGGTLQVFNYADYIWPGLVKRSRSSTTARSRSRPTTPPTRLPRSSRPARRLRRRDRPQRQQHGARCIAQQLMLPLNHSYLPNLAKNIWARAAGPVLRPRRALHGALRRLAWTASAGATTRSARTSPA